MISSLFAGPIASIRHSICCGTVSRPYHNSARPCHNRAAKRATPTVEVLEDRYLLSATTVVPSLAEIPITVALPDILAAAQPKGNPSVIFVGDSISWEYAYGTGSSVWSAYMAPLGMADYGVIGQTTQSLLFQFSLGLLTNINPALVVLDIGGNDLLQGASPQDTAAGVLADVSVIQQSLPQAQILVLGVLPGGQSPNDPYRLLGAQINQIVSQMLVGDPHTAFLDVGSIFLQADGTISTTMMFDYLHPTTLGYQNLTNVLLPTIEQELFSGSAIPSFSPLGSLGEWGTSSMSSSSSQLPIAPA